MAQSYLSVIKIVGNWWIHGWMDEFMFQYCNSHSPSALCRQVWCKCPQTREKRIPAHCPFKSNTLYIHRLSSKHPVKKIDNQWIVTTKMWKTKQKFNLSNVNICCFSSMTANWISLGVFNCLTDDKSFCILNLGLWEIFFTTLTFYRLNWII